MSLYRGGNTYVMPVVLLALLLVAFTGCVQDIPVVGPMIAPLLGMETPVEEVVEADSHGAGHDAESDEDDDEDVAPPVQATGPLKLSEMDRFRDTPFEKITLKGLNGDALTGWLATPLAVERKKAEALAALADEDDEDDDEGDDEDEEGDDIPTQAAPLVILLHGLNGAYPDWAGFPSRLLEKGYAVLAIDMRGHGASRPKGQDWRRFKPEDWQTLPKDVTRIVQSITRPWAVVDGEVTGGLPEHLDVDPARTWVVGAGVGANVAILAAREATISKLQPVALQGLVLLSPTLEYKGLRTLEAMYDLDAPTLMLASQSDMASNDASPMLYRMLSGKKSLKIFESLGHGTDMVRFYPQLQTLILDWMTTIAPADALPVPGDIRHPPELDDEDDEDE